jgi:hypothetical protein
MNYIQLKQLLLEAAENGTLMTPKHDPDKLGEIFCNYRSVLSDSLAENLLSFINSEDYSAAAYHNNNSPQSPLYLTITPNPQGNFSVPASGVTGHTPTESLDTLIVVSGKTQGLHMFGSSYDEILASEMSGMLVNKVQIKEL